MANFNTDATSSPSILLVTTCWWASLARFAHLLQEAGCRVSVLCPPGHAARAAPITSILDHDPVRPLRGLSRAIARLQPMLVLPGDERALGHLHRLYRTGSLAERQLIAYSIGSPETYRISASRSLFLTAAVQAGIATPAGMSINTVEDLRSWMARVDPPWVLKVDGASSGIGVRITDCPRTAEAEFYRLHKGTTLPFALKRLIVNQDAFWLGDWLARECPAVSVQRYIHGRRGDLAMICRHGEMLAAQVVEAVACKGLTGPSIIVRRVDRPELVAGARRLARRLGLSGFIGLDFMMDDAGNALVIEMNARITPLCNLRLEGGPDLIGAFMQSLTGRETVPRQPAPAGLIAHFPAAWHWNSADERLAYCYKDIPWKQPALLAAMLQPPWPDRRPVVRALAGMRRYLGIPGASNLPGSPLHRS
jgi:ATP-grasp domain-containing protein